MDEAASLLDKRIKDAVDKEKTACVYGRGIFWRPELRIQFRNSIKRQDISNVAADLAQFVSAITGEQHEVVDESSISGTEYRLVHTNGNEAANYRIISGVDVIYIRMEMVCRHDAETLEEYMHSVCSAGK